MSLQSTGPEQGGAVPRRVVRTAVRSVGMRGKRKRAEVPLATGRLTNELLDGDLNRAMGFKDFVFQLGLHYRLPGRTVSTDLTPAKPVVVRTRRWLVISAIVVVSWFAMSSRDTHDRSGERVLPVDVTGEWKAVTAPYAGRAITLLRDSVVLHFGEEQAPVGFPITSVQRSVVEDSTVFEVRYVQGDRETQLTFALARLTSPTLSLRNTAGVVWRRTSAKDAPATPPLER